MNYKKNEIYIYGAGSRGKELLEIISSQYEKMILVKGFIDREKIGSINGVPIYSIRDISKEKVIVVSIACFESALQVVMELKTNGVEHVFWYTLPNKRNQYKDFFVEQCVDCKEWSNDTLRQIEMHAMDACNLNCVGCSHFSPIFPMEIPITETRLYDIELLHEKISSIAQFYILGGEPFLNNEIERYTDKIKKIYPYTSVTIVTNGLLIPKLSNSLLEYIGKNNICIIITEYEPTRRMMDRIIEVLNQYNIIYYIRKYDEQRKFNKPLSVKESDDYYCISKECFIIGKNKIARCPTLMYINDLNKKFNLNFPTEGIIDLRCNMSGNELKNQLYKEVPLCRYCVKNEIDWQTCGKDVRVEHFVKK